MRKWKGGLDRNNVLRHMKFPGVSNTEAKLPPAELWMAKWQMRQTSISFIESDAWSTGVQLKREALLLTMAEFHVITYHTD